MAAILCAVFFVSGAAALLFETLWFRQAGLALGNTVWASALVIAAFMGGLGIGNAAAARWGRRIRRPLLAYAAFEVLVAIAGVCIVLLFPGVGRALAPLMGTLGDAGLNGLRVSLSFALLLVPSAAMGATLPLLTGALSACDGNFGRVLGRLYGWNTLGAVAGTLVGELFLIEAIGVRRTALVAAAMSLLAAFAAVLIARRLASDIGGEPVHTPTNRKAWRILAAAALAGGLLLALEVVWFRFMLSFLTGSAWTFAVMLAVVLMGIAFGSLLASFLLGRYPQASAWSALPAFLAGAAVVWSYAAVLSEAPAETLTGYFRLALPIMLPTCVLSGALFAMLGRALNGHLREATRSTGLLTLANTLGSMTGSLAAGFFLLPLLGVERSLFLLACLYGVVGLLCWSLAGRRRERLAAGAAGALFGVVLALFPFGLMERHYLPEVASNPKWEANRVIAIEEGLTETVMILRRESLGQALSHRLVTNAISMSATNFVARRYMGLYAWWPVAVHPSPRRALLVSYGLGTTARALVETRQLERIDVVDTSATVLRLSVLAQESGGNPLDDPRVRTHIEDGRFFLQMSRDRYDIITSEPPPPKTAGVSSLYSQEYFELIRERLAEGGIVTYWLPVYQLSVSEARSVVSGFCAAFEDCSLWTGYGLEWMLVGTRGSKGPVSAEHFAAQWNDPLVAGRLEEAGIEDPSQLGALFLADAPALRAFVNGAPPVNDDHPYRLSPRLVFSDENQEHVRFLRTERAEKLFVESELIGRLWPEEWKQRSRDAFGAQDLLNAVLSDLSRGVTDVSNLERLLSATSFRAPVLWAMGTSVAEVSLAQAAAGRGESAPLIEEFLGMEALSRRQYREADRRLALAELHASHASRLRMWRALALALAGDAEGSARALASVPAMPRATGSDPVQWQWLAARFGLAGQIGSGVAR